MQISESAFHETQRAQYRAKISREEKKIANKILENPKSSSFGDFYQNSYNRVADLAQQGPFETFVCIGMGPLPTTLFFVDDHNLARRLIGVDVDSEAVRLAKRLSQAHNREQIEFYEDLSEVTWGSLRPTFFIANLVSPKLRVLESLKDIVMPGELVIVREPSANGEGFSEKVSDQISSNWNIMATGPVSHQFLSQNTTLMRV